MKKALVLLLFLLAWSPVAVWAHTGLKKAVPGEGETVKEDVRHIELTFNTPIESGSSFEVRDQSGKRIHPSEIRVKGNTLSGMWKEPLPPGEYTVRWNIIGADGHPVNGSYSFRVANREKPSETSPVEKTSPKATRETEKPSAPSSASAGTPWVAGVLLALLIAAAAGFLWMWRKR